MKISKLLYRDDRWCQGCLAVNKIGKRLDNLNIYHYSNGTELDPSKECVAYSLQGAIVHLYNGENQGDVFTRLGNAARLYYGQKIWVAEFNDLSSTTYKDVMKVLKIADL